MKNIKVIISTLAVMSVLVLNSIGASAEWKQDSNGWWNSEGSSWSVGWKQIDGKWYYFNLNGYMAHDENINGYTLGSDGAWIQSAQNSYEKLDKLPQNYTVEMAKKDGDVLFLYTDKKDYNIEKLDKFIENYKNKKANLGDMVRIVNRTDEGDPIIFDLTMDSDGAKLKIDSTRDAYSSDKDRIIKEYKVVDIYKTYMTGYISYSLKTDQGEERFLYSSSIH